MDLNKVGPWLLLLWLHVRLLLHVRLMLHRKLRLLHRKLLRCERLKVVCSHLLHRKGLPDRTEERAAAAAEVAAYKTATARKSAKAAAAQETAEV